MHQGGQISTRGTGIGRGNGETGKGENGEKGGGKRKRDVPRIGLSVADDGVSPCDCELFEHLRQDRRAKLAPDVVSEDRDARCDKALRPHGVAGDEHGERIDERDLGFDADACPELDCFLAADGEVGHEDVDGRFLEPPHNVGFPHVRKPVFRLPQGFCRRERKEPLLVPVVGRDHVLCDAVEARRRLHDDAAEHGRVARSGWHAWEEHAAVGQCKHRFTERRADFAHVRVERYDGLNVADGVAANVSSDDPWRVGVEAVVHDALQERGRAVAHAHDGNTNRFARR